MCVPRNFLFSWPICTKFGANMLLETASTSYSLIHDNQKQEDGRRTKLARWEQFQRLLLASLGGLNTIW